MSWFARAVAIVSFLVAITGVPGIHIDVTRAASKAITLLTGFDNRVIADDPATHTMAVGGLLNGHGEVVLMDDRTDQVLHLITLSSSTPVAQFVFDTPRQRVYVYARHSGLDFSDTTLWGIDMSRGKIVTTRTTQPKGDAGISLVRVDARSGTVAIVLADTDTTLATISPTNHVMKRRVLSQLSAPVTIDDLCVDPRSHHVITQESGNVETIAAYDPHSLKHIWRHTLRGCFNKLL